MTPEQVQAIKKIHGGLSPFIDELIAEIERLQAELETAQAPNPANGHDQPCYYCGELCNAVAGNPEKWPIPLCHPEEPGKVKWHHVGCVSERLRKIERLPAELEAVRAEKELLLEQL